MKLVLEKSECMQYFYLNNYFTEIKTNNANAMVCYKMVYMPCVSEYSKGIFLNDFLKWRYDVLHWICGYKFISIIIHL